MHSGITDWLN